MDAYTFGQYQIFIAIEEERERLRLKKAQLNYNRSFQFGHDFGYQRVCVCGLGERDYRATPLGERKICPLAENYLTRGENLLQ